jgi:hypothetical protein
MAGVQDEGDRAREREQDEARDDRGGPDGSQESVERQAWEGAEDARSRVGKGGEREAEQYPAVADGGSD